MVLRDRPHVSDNDNMVNRRQDDPAHGYDVFISHARGDSLLAQALAQELSAAGYRVFDASEHRPGEDFVASVTEALATARVVVALILGDQGVGASQRLELQYAQVHGRLGRALVIPVASTQAQLRALPQGLREFHGIALQDRGDISTAADHIIAALRRPDDRLDDDLGRPPYADDVGYWEGVVADVERLVGPDHPEAVDSRNNLARALYAAGRLTEALALYEQAFALRERLLGPEHPSTLTTRANLAGVYGELGQFEQAAALLEATLADSERVLGTEHPSTLTTRANLAGVYGELGQFEQAAALLEATLADSERVLGAEHRLSEALRGNLTALLDRRDTRR